MLQRYFQLSITVLTFKFQILHFTNSTPTLAYVLQDEGGVLAVGTPDPELARGHVLTGPLAVHVEPVVGLIVSCKEKINAKCKHVIVMYAIYIDMYMSGGVT